MRPPKTRAHSLISTRFPCSRAQKRGFGGKAPSGSPRKNQGAWNRALDPLPPDGSWWADQFPLGGPGHVCGKKMCGRGESQHSGDRQAAPRRLSPDALPICVEVRGDRRPLPHRCPWHQPRNLRGASTFHPVRAIWRETNIARKARLPLATITCCAYAPAHPFSRRASSPRALRSPPSHTLQSDHPAGGGPGDGGRVGARSHSNLITRRMTYTNLKSSNRLSGVCEIVSVYAFG
jgi:hypothetical protein